MLFFKKQSDGELLCIESELLLNSCFKSVPYIDLP